MSTVHGASLNGHSLHASSVNGASGADRLVANGLDAHPTPIAGVPLTPGNGASQPAASFDDVDQQKAQLEAALADATARLAAARQRAVVRDAEVRAVLHAELLASKETLARMEREYEMAIAMVEQAAAVEAERVLAEARERVAGRARPASSNGAPDAE